MKKEYLLGEMHRYFKSIEDSFSAIANTNSTESDIRKDIENIYLSSRCLNHDAKMLYDRQYEN